MGSGTGGAWRALQSAAAGVAEPGLAGWPLAPNAACAWHAASTHALRMRVAWRASHLAGGGVGARHFRGEAHVVHDAAALAVQVQRVAGPAGVGRDGNAGGRLSRVSTSDAAACQGGSRVGTRCHGWAAQPPISPACGQPQGQPHTGTHTHTPGGPRRRKVDAAGAHAGGGLAGRRRQRGAQQAARLWPLHSNNHRLGCHAAAVCQRDCGCAACRRRAGHGGRGAAEPDGGCRQARRQLVGHRADAVCGQAVLACVGGGERGGGGYVRVGRVQKGRRHSITPRGQTPPRQWCPAALPPLHPAAPPPHPATPPPQHPPVASMRMTKAKRREVVPRERSKKMPPRKGRKKRSMMASLKPSSCGGGGEGGRGARRETHVSKGGGSREARDRPGTGAAPQQQLQVQRARQEGRAGHAAAAPRTHASATQAAVQPCPSPVAAAGWWPRAPPADRPGCLAGSLAGTAPRAACQPGCQWGCPGWPARRPGACGWQEGRQQWQVCRQ